MSREYPATSAATIAANLRPILPEGASAMARDPVRGSIMYDGTVGCHRGDTRFRAVIGALWLLSLWLGAAMLWGTVFLALSALLCGAVLILFGLRECCPIVYAD
jgi:hypothetical protein